MAHDKINRGIARTLAVVIGCISISEAKAQSCADLSSEISTLNLQAASMLFRSPTASAVTVTCAAVANKTTEGFARPIAFAGCVSAACYMKGDFWSCSSTATDWYALVRKQEALEAKRRAQRC